MTAPKLPPLPPPLMELHLELHQHVYAAWADQMHAYGLACYRQGLKDAANEIRNELTSVTANHDIKAMAEWYALALDVKAKEIT